MGFANFAEMRKCTRQMMERRKETVARIVKASSSIGVDSIHWGYVHLLPPGRAGSGRFWKGDNYY